MAIDVKLSELSQAASVVTTDLIAISQDDGGSYNSKKVVFNDVQRSITTLGSSGSSSNNTSIESDGTVVFNGAAVVWEDLKIVPGAFRFSGTADPSIQDWQPGGSGATFKVYKFNSSDQVFATIQMPHCWKLDTDLYPHIHWTPCDEGVANSGNTVAWKIDYSWGNIDGVFPSSSTIDLTDTCTGTDDYHEIKLGTPISGSGKTLSSILMLRIYRDTGDNWTGTGANAPTLLEFDFHYQIDTVGSRQELVK